MIRSVSFVLAVGIVFCFTIVQKAQAQEDTKFGKISEKELTMTHYDKDTTASAAVLFDKGVLDGRTLDFKRHLRIKIFKKSGYEWANLIVDVPGRSSVRGFTYNLEGGEIIKTKVERESVFQEEVVEDFFVMRVFMPNVKEGSIIEIEYTHFLPPFVWKFQDEIPVVYSELELQPNTYIDFSKNMFGYEPLAISTMDRWVAKDMPAMKVEPFTNSIENYINKMEMEVRSVSFPGSVYRDYASTWDNVYKSLMRSSRFGEELTRSSFMKSEAKDIMAKYSSTEERIKAAHQFIKDNIKWNGDESLYASSDLNIIYNKDKIGNSADVNLSLIALIRQMDIGALPVILSTVDNGILSLAMPSRSKLNYVIGYYKDGDKEYFLDATEPNISVGMLPERCLNDNGRLIGENINRWVNLSSNDLKNKETVQAEFSIDEAGNITGKINCKSEEYAALHLRDKLDKINNEKNYLEQFEEKYVGLQLNNYSITNRNEKLAEPVLEDFEVDVTEMADDLGGTLAFSPLFFNINFDNPFKSLSRVYPVHFNQPIYKTSVVRVAIPEGYSFVDLPKPVNVSLPDNGGKFMYSVSKVGENEIQLYYKLDVTKTMFLPTDYPYLQKLYSIIVDNLSQHILIKSKT